MRTPIALVFLVGCTTTVGTDGFVQPDVDPTFDAAKLDSVDTAWTGVGLGVEYQRVNTGNGVLIAYGGYTARMSYSAAWATELVDQELGALGVGQIYAVKGPQDPGYDAREIANTKLRAHLKMVDDGASPIFVVAHSSGSYVAHELFQQMVNRGETGFLSRVHYADLDGGGSGLDDEIVDGMAAIAFVYARDPVAGDSRNASTARYLGDAYAPKASSVRVTVDHTGCNSGAGWCMHDVVVTHRPHNHSTFDLADDYTDFDGRPVTIEYFGSITD
jgi:hypothetical protein